jgi:flagellar hook-length control protein FliK
MQTATDMPDAMVAQGDIAVDSATEPGGELASLPAIIASVPLGSVEAGVEETQFAQNMNVFTTPMDDTTSDVKKVEMPEVPKTEISDGALAMAQTLLVAQSVGLVDAVDGQDTDTDAPATLNLKIGTPMPAMKKDQINSESDLPVTVPAELFAKARALVKGEVTAPSRTNYDTGPQPVHQLMNFLKQSVVPKDEKTSRVQPIATPLSDDAMPKIISKPVGEIVTYNTPHTVALPSAVATPHVADAPQVIASQQVVAASHAVLPTHDMAVKTTPMPVITDKLADDIVTYSEPHTVLSAQQFAKRASSAPMPTVMAKSTGNIVTYDTPHTVLTANDMVAKTTLMPAITGKATGNAVLYSEAHTVIEAKAEPRIFDVAQASKQSKTQLNNIIDSGVAVSAPKHIAARASIIVDNGAMRLQGEKSAPQRLLNDTAPITQISESSNSSGAQTGSNRGDGGGFDQASRGNSQIMTAHRLNMADKSWQEGFVRRVENSIKNGDSVIRIALEPRQLGRMQVKLGFQGGATRIQISTETAAAAALLSEGESRLSQMLDQAGLRLGNLQTNATGSSGFDQNANMAGQGNSGQAGTSEGNGDQSGQKSHSAHVSGEAETDDETSNTSEKDNKTVLNILA